MPLGGIAASMAQSVPSATSQAGTGYQDIQSLKTTMQQVFDSEHIFPSTGGAGSGAHRKGSAVAFVDPSSRISSSDTNGRLLIDSTNSRLHHVGSTDTRFLGGQYVVEGAAYNYYNGASPSKITQVYGMEVGETAMYPGSLTTAVTLRNSYTLASVTCPSPYFGGSPMANFVLPDPPVGTTLTFRNYRWSGDTASNVVSTQTYSFTWHVAGIRAL